jgi:hypothetical protein
VPCQDFIALKNDTEQLAHCKLARQHFAYLSVFVPPTSIPITHDVRSVDIAWSTYTGPAVLNVAEGDMENDRHNLKYEKASQSTCSPI